MVLLVWAAKEAMFLVFGDEGLPVWLLLAECLLDGDEGVDIFTKLCLDSSEWRFAHGQEVELHLVVLILRHTLLNKWLRDLHPVFVSAVAEVHWLAFEAVELPEVAADGDEGDEVESGFAGAVVFLAVRLCCSLGFAGNHVVVQGKVGVKHIHLSGEGVVDTAEVVMVSNRVAAECWSHGRGEFFERGKGWSDLDVGGVHDDVEQGDAGACVVGSLVGEPDVFWARGFLLAWVIFFELKEEDEAVYWLSVVC